MTEGERVKHLRKDKLNQTLEEFGSKLGVTKVAISNIEKGNRALTDQMAKSISREFGVREEWLRTGEGDMFAELDLDAELSQWAEKMLSGQKGDFRQRFVRLLARLSDVQWKQLEEFALFLAGMDVKPEVDPEQEIQDEVADYERQLRLEKEVEGKSSASESTSGTA